MALWTKFPTPNPGVTTGTIDDQVRNVLLQEYGDHGNWARHYSSVRMTLGTLFLGAAAAVLYKDLDKPNIQDAVLSGITLAAGSLLFALFSKLTFDSMNRQLAVVSSYRDALLPTPTPPATKPRPIANLNFMRWDGAGLIAIAWIAFITFIAWWHPTLWTPAAPPAPPIAAAPPPAQFEMTYSAVHQTNHGQEAHTFLLEKNSGALWQMTCEKGDKVTFKAIDQPPHAKGPRQK